jgi:hypothetical protein
VAHLGESVNNNEDMGIGYAVSLAIWEWADIIHRDIGPWSERDRQRVEESWGLEPGALCTLAKMATLDKGGHITGESWPVVGPA